MPEKKAVGGVEEKVAAIAAEVRSWREHLHENPELGLEVFETTRFVEERLAKWGYRPVRPPGLETGAVALLEGRGRAPDGKRRVVALRADMDGLPITEETGLPYASKATAVHLGERVGVMHACGHDGHTAVQLGVAKILREMEAELPGTVKFLFQPGEEGGGGGRIMAEGGVLKNPDVDAVFAFHCRCSVPVGRVQLALTPNAATDSLEIEIRGSGGHGAYPQTTVDPIPVAAQVIGALQTVVSRKICPSRPAVVSITAVQGGTTYNVIPDRVFLKGTLRTVDRETRDTAMAAIETIARKTAEASGATAEVKFVDGYPAVHNDPRLLEFVRKTASDLFGAENVLGEPDQTMGGEDFSYFLADQGGVPGVIFRVGVGCEANQHTARFDFGSGGIVPALRIMTTIAVRFLRDGAPGVA
jgi:amidohydrolase